MNWDNLSEKFKDIGFKHNVDYKKTHNLMEIVKKFISRKELIIYGGVAVDYALRLKGDKLYDNVSHPDIDVYSPNYLKDAKELVDELSIMGFKDVSAITGMHLLTMRIRCDFIYILDISYIPPSVFSKIPILKYNNFTFVDPIFQMMDIHSSLSFSYYGTPMENIINRFKKDINRYNLLIKYYHPKKYIGKKKKLVNNKYIKPKSFLKLNTTKTFEKNTAKTFEKIKVDISTIPSFIVKDKDDGKLAITGFGAYAILRKTLDEVAELLNIKVKITAPRLDIQFLENYISLEVPNIKDNNYIHFVTYAYLDTIKFFSDTKIERYNSYLDINYENIKINNIIIFSTEMKLISASYIPIGNDKYIHIATSQHVLLYFLFQYHLTNYTIYLEYYIHLLDIIAAAEKIFEKLISQNLELSDELINIFNNSIFAPIITPFGKLNISTTYIIQEGKKITTLDDIDNIPESTGLQNIIFTDVVKDLPNNIYPFKPLQHINTKNILYSQYGKKMPLTKEHFFN
jgi:hypothetical protein